jgi:hypothetical protein
VANIYAGIDNSDGDNFKIGESFTTPYVSFTPSTGNATFAGTADITNGVYIGGSAAANLLDDYEEGTWTPTWAVESGAAPSIGNGTLTGRYTKIGRVALFNAKLLLTL